MKLFAKLPKDFKVPTPLGTYEPDWAVLVEEDGSERLCFVVETAGDLLESRRRGRENQNITCGRPHFAALASEHKQPAKYRVTRSLEAMLASDQACRGPTSSRSGSRGHLAVLENRQIDARTVGCLVKTVLGDAETRRGALQTGVRRYRTVEANLICSRTKN